MTQPLTGHTNRRCRRFRTNMAIDSFSAALVSFVLKRTIQQRGRERWQKSELLAEEWGTRCSHVRITIVTVKRIKEEEEREMQEVKVWEWTAMIWCIYTQTHTPILAVALIIPVTSGEEWQNKSFIRVLHCIPDDYEKFLSCKCPCPPPALKKLEEKLFFLSRSYFH